MPYHDRIPHDDPLGHYDEEGHAERFDELARTQLRYSYPMMACRALESLDRKDGKCLELSCGTGWLAIELAKRSDMEIVATDASKEMLKRAERNVASAGLSDRIALKPMTMPDLDMPDVSFDLVLSLRSFHHYPEPDRVLSEAFRIIRPNGLIFIEDTNRGVPEDIKERIAAQIGDGEARNRFLRSIGHGYTIEEVQAMLIIAGLEDNSDVSTTVWTEDAVKECGPVFKDPENPYWRAGLDAAATTLTVRVWK